MEWADRNRRRTIPDNVLPRSFMNRPAWIEGFLLGALAGALSVWLGLAAIPLIVAILFWTALTVSGRQRSGGTLIGLAAGSTLITLSAASGCPALLGGDPSACSGPDLRFILVLAATAAIAGVFLSLRRPIR